MGTIATNVKPENISDWFKSKLTWSDAGGVRECLETKIVQRTEAYAAVRTTYPDGKTEVWAAVFTLGYAGPDGMKFSYRAEDETVGPFVARCPASILDQLTPTESANANEWRNRCRERLQRRHENAGLGNGNIVRTSAPIYFGESLGHADVFQVVHNAFIRRGRTTTQTRFVALDEKTGEQRFDCRIQNWRDLELTPFKLELSMDLQDEGVYPTPLAP